MDLLNISTLQNECIMKTIDYKEIHETYIIKHLVITYMNNILHK